LIRTLIIYATSTPELYEVLATHICIFNGKPDASMPT
jgi:hypothetical protein